MARIMLPNGLSMRSSPWLTRVAIPAARRLPAGPATRRWNSSKASVHSSFYKTFSRPVAKTLLLAIFTYQLAYFGWTKLEQDEIRAEREGQIQALEAQVKDLQEKQAASK